MFLKGSLLIAVVCACMSACTATQVGSSNESPPRQVDTSCQEDAACFEICQEMQVNERFIVDTFCYRDAVCVCGSHTDLTTSSGRHEEGCAWVSAALENNGTGTVSIPDCVFDRAEIIEILDQEIGDGTPNVMF